MGRRFRPQINVRHRDELKQESRPLLLHAIIHTVGFSSSAAIGFFLGFTFGIGCALAVMYSIYSGGYRAAIKDAQLPVAPERLLQARAKAARADSAAPL